MIGIIESVVGTVVDGTLDAASGILDSVIPGSSKSDNGVYDSNSTKIGYRDSDGNVHLHDE
jgi:hypothetical protein